MREIFELGSCDDVLASAMRNICVFMFMMMSPAWSQQKGSASAELWVSSSSVKAGQSVPAAIRMVYDTGWHGYWINPGESGMRPEVEWELPEGWTAGPLEFPVPKRMMTGELASYGYEGEVLLPFTLTAPAEVNGAQVIKGTISWLACNDKSCVSGDAEIQATVTLGEGVAGPHAEAITKVMASLPVKEEKAKLSVSEKDGSIGLTITGAAIDLQDAEVFPVTEQALDHRLVIQLKKSAAGYEASVKKNEYATESLSELSLLIVPKTGPPAIVVEWKK